MIITYKIHLIRNSIVSAEIAYPVPSVRSGPKARKIANSPKPLLATSLKGLAV